MIKFVLLFFMVGSVHAVEYKVMPKPMTVEYKVWVNGEEITGPMARCETLPSDYRPLRCPAGYSCTNAQGSAAVRARQLAKDKWEAYKTMNDLEHIE
jgi:hypothetical protein